MANPKRTKYNRGDRQSGEMARSLDDLAFFDKFFNDIAPKLRQMVIDGATANDIYKIAEAQTAARMLTIAMTEKDPKIAMQAIKEMHDRSLGKAKESMEITSRYEALSEEDLQQLIREEEQKREELPN